MSCCFLICKGVMYAGAGGVVAVLAGGYRALFIVDAKIGSREYFGQKLLYFKRAWCEPKTSGGGGGG